MSPLSKRMVFVQLTIRAALVCGLTSGALVAAGLTVATAQSLESVQSSERPLVLKSRGSFFVGGESVEQTEMELGSRGPADRITVNQMYVDYMVPDGSTNLPVIMIHGATLTGKSWDTTPDGRMGWFEYFVRSGHPTYVADQVGRGRSGFNQAALNRAIAGETPREDAPKPWRFGDRKGAWTNFRFGPTAGEAFPEQKFPTAAAGELAKQSIPDLTPLVPIPNPTIGAISQLAADLQGAVLISHSQSGHFPMEAVLGNPDGVRAIVALEPGRCLSKVYTDEQIADLAKVPTLVVFGDNLASPTGFPGPNWQDRYDDCSVYVQRINAAKGNAKIMQTSELGVRGNSHMLMQDSNSLGIADVVLKWIADNTVAPARR